MTHKKGRFKKGHSGFWKGKSLSEEHRRHIGKSLIGREVSESTRRKIGLHHKGKKISEQQRINHSKLMKQLYSEGKMVSPMKDKKGVHLSPKTEFKKGNPSWNKGKTYHRIGGAFGGFETRYKKGHEVWSKGLHIWKNKKHPDGMLGKHHTEETKKKIRERRLKQIFPIKDTTIEVKIQNFLKQLNIEFFTHYHIKEIEHSYQCDILIPSMNLVIECDGDYWHKYPVGTDIDHIRTSELLQKGFKVLRLWEFEIRKMNLNDFKSKLDIHSRGILPLSSELLLPEMEGVDCISGVIKFQEVK